MLRPSPNHGTQRLPNDDYDETNRVSLINSARVTVIVTVVRIGLNLRRPRRPTCDNYS